MPTSSVMPTYNRLDVTFERGEGAWLYATDGRRFLDFAAGIAVNALGHCHPRLTRALQEQGDRLWHVSNLYKIAGQEKVAGRLAAATFADKIFFCNSGAEANEGAIKMARRFQYAGGHPERFRIICAVNAFHGRTLATLAAGGQPRYLEGFGPVVQGFDHVPYNDLATMEAAIGPETAAILVEPLQGEGGLVAPDPDYLPGLRALADRYGLLLMFDEVQTGMGRTGRLFAHQHTDVTPDVMSTAKGLGGGFPVGAVLATDRACGPMTAGSHASTFGGNPLGMALVDAVLDELLLPGFLPEVVEKGLYLRGLLDGVATRHAGAITAIRGQGLMVGVKTTAPNIAVVGKLFERGLLTVPAGDNVVRFLPPLVVTREELDEAVGHLDTVLAAGV